MAQVVIDNRYKVVKRLGAGAMGDVYQVEDKKDNRLRALKILSREKTSSESVQRFKREFQILTELHHPNLCAVYDFGMLKDGRSYFTMEFVDGSNIFDVTQDLPLGKVYPLVVQLCRALEYIHAKGLIHYDIKPGNVMVQMADDNWVVKLMDFGLAGEELIKGGILVKGTIPYIAPELIKGLAVDHRADLFSLGVLLYEVFTRCSFKKQGRESFVALLKQRLEKVAEPIKKIAADIPNLLARLILQLLSSEPAERFSRANELIKELNKISGAKFELETEKTLEGYLLSSKFVGREKEVASLKSFYEQARRGQSKMVLVKGRTGVGKSRLLKEFKVYTQLERSHCIVSSAYRGETRALAPLLDIFKDLISYLGDGREIRTSLAILAKMFPDLVAAPLKRGLPELVALEPRQEKLRNFEALAEIIRQAAREIGSLVIFLEDLHLADTLTIQFFEYLGHNLMAYNIFVCSTARTEEIEENPVMKAMVNNLKDSDYFDQIELAPFNFKNLYSFLDSMITPASNSTELANYLMEKTSGNPFFVEEILRTFLKTQKMSIGERIEIDQIKKVRIPVRIEDVVLERLKELDQTSQCVVKYGAILVRHFTYDLMKRLTGLDDRTLSKTLWELKRRQVLIEDGNQYRFYHTTLHEALNKRLNYRDRIALNYQAGKTLEQINRHRLDQVVEDLAFYFVNAQDHKKGIVYGLRAAQQSSERYANEQAIKFYKDVLGLLGEKEIRKRFDVLQRIAQIEVFAGHYDDSIRNYHQALVMKGVTPLECADIYRKIGDVLRKKPKYQEALRAYDKGVKLLPGGRSNKRSALVSGALNMGIAYAYLGMGDSRNANKYNFRALDFLGNLRTRDVMMLQNDVFYNIGIIETDLGHYDRALFYFKKAYECNKKIKNDIGVALILFAFGYCHYLMGSFQKSFSYYQRSMQLSEKIGNPRGIARSLIQLACILYKKGDFNTACSYFQRGQTIATKIGAHREVALALQGIGNCYQMSGIYKEALDNYQKSLKYWGELEIRDNEAATYLDAGDLYCATAEYALAYRFYHRAYDIYRTLGRPFETAQSQMRLAALDLDLGAFSRAQQHLDNALHSAAPIDSKVIEVDGYKLRCLMAIIQKDIPRAFAYYKKGVALVHELSFRKEALHFAILLAEIYYLKEKYKKGMVAVNRAIATAKAKGPQDLYVAGILLKVKNGIEHGLSKIECGQLLAEAEGIAEKIGCPEMRWKTYYAYIGYFQKYKENDKALMYFKKCIVTFKEVLANIKNDADKRSYLARPDRQSALMAIK